MHADFNFKGAQKMHIQRIQSFSIYNNNNSCQRKINNNQIHFKGVGDDYGMEDDAFNKMNERRRVREDCKRLNEDDDRTFWEFLIGEKKQKHPLNPNDPRIESLEEEPRKKKAADDLADAAEKDNE